jgi:hypothetical protein
VAAGFTALVPVRATLPIPWSIVIVVAPETFQLRFELPPAEMLDGSALKERIEGCAPGTPMVIGPPLQPAINIDASTSIGISLFIFNLLK